MTYEDRRLFSPLRNFLRGCFVDDQEQQTGLLLLGVGARLSAGRGRVGRVWRRHARAGVDTDALSNREASAAA
jgi:hypothetical protein